MGQSAKAIRHNRTITVDFQDKSTYFQLRSDGKAFVEFVLAFLFALGFQLSHKATCAGGGCLTRHSYYARIRLGGLTMVVYLPNADKDRGLTCRPSQGQKGRDERTLMASQRPFHPW